MQQGIYGGIMSSIISKDSVIVNQYRNINKINIAAIVEKSINDNKNDIIKAQQEQLKTGTRGDGKKITPKYSKSTEKRKGFKTPNLFDTGDMYAGMDLIVGVPNDKEYSIFSDVDYFPKLNEKYDKAFDLFKADKKVPSVNNDILKNYHIAINK